MIKPIVAGLSLSFAVSGAFANQEQNKAMADMVLSMYNSQSEDTQEAAACLGIPATKLNKTVTDAIRDCYDQHKNETFEAFSQKLENCMTQLENSMAKKLGVSEAKLNECDTDQEEDEDWESDDYADSEAEMQEETAAMLKRSAAASEKTLHLITLPIYPGSRVMMHALAGMKMNGVTTLPAATFSSTDSADKIKAYYQKKLPNYKISEDDSGTIYLMKTLPKNFDLLKHWNEYASTPHITITPIESANQLAPDAKTTIEVAYEPK